MRFRAVVLAGCFCLALLGSASGASAQSALPNGYTIPEAYSNGWDAPSILVARYTDGEHFCGGEPVDFVDPVTGAITCASVTNAEGLPSGSSNGCWLGSLKVKSSWGESALRSLAARTAPFNLRAA